MIALIALLAGIALLSLRPWEPDSVGPQVRISPERGIGLGDALALAPGRQQLGVAGARVATDGKDGFGGAPVAVPRNASVPVLDVSPARAVSGPRPATAPADQPESAPPPAPAPPPVPVAAPPAVAAASPPAPAPAVVPAPSPPRFLASGGGPGEFSAVRIEEGDEYALAFFFRLEGVTYGQPGADNLILHFKGDVSGSRSFGLQLWEDAEVGASSRGLWSSGEAVGGDRFLAPVPERVWHRAIVFFRASSQGDGFYEIHLDGQRVDARSGISLIASGGGHTQIEVGLFRGGGPVRGTGEVRIDEAVLGESLESVLP